MADARNEPLWNTQVSRSELESAEPVGAGAQFSTINRGQPYTATITDYVRPDRLTFQVHGKRMDITGAMHFTAIPTGTRLEADFDFQPRGLMAVVMRLMAPAIRRGFPRQFAGFATFCESRPAG